MKKRGPCCLSLVITTSLPPIPGSVNVSQEPCGSEALATPSQTAPGASCVHGGRKEERGTACTTSGDVEHVFYMFNSSSRGARSSSFRRWCGLKSRHRPSSLSESNRAVCNSSCFALNCGGSLQCAEKNGSLVKPLLMMSNHFDCYESLRCIKHCSLYVTVNHYIPSCGSFSRIVNQPLIIHQLIMN